jgi:hypothetical protein
MIFEELTPASALKGPAPILPLVDGNHPYGVMRKRHGESDFADDSSTGVGVVAGVPARAARGRQRKSRIFFMGRGGILADARLSDYAKSAKSSRVRGIDWLAPGWQCFPSLR